MGSAKKQKRKNNAPSKKNKELMRSLNGGGANCVKYWICYAKGEVGDESLSLEASNLEDVFNEVADLYGMTAEDFKNGDYTIEARKGDKWKEVESFSDLKGGDSKCGVAVRVPAFYDDATNPINAPYYEQRGNEVAGTNHQSFKNTLCNILKEMKEKGFKPISILKFSKEGKTKLFLTRELAPTETISTKQFILNLANENEDLRDLLINRIGALHHFAEAVHYPFAEMLKKTSDEPGDEPISDLSEDEPLGDSDDEEM